MKVSANSGLGAHLTEPEGFRSAQHNVSVRRSPTIQKSPQSSPDLGEKMALQSFRTPAGDCARPCDGTEGRPWRRTQSHSSAIRGVAPIHTQTPTEIQRPSCFERQTYTQGRTPTLHLALEEKGGSVYLPPQAQWTQEDSVCV